jgi:CheY-like chemotaxis protein
LHQRVGELLWGLMVVSDDSATIVLLVDDDPSHLKLYSWIVSRDGYRPVTALVGTHAVALPRASRIDVAVMDYRFSSQISAPEVARHIREQYPGTPIILISELLWMPDDMTSLVDAFVTKGDPEALLAKIAEFSKGTGTTRAPNSDFSSHD